MEPKAVITNDWRHGRELQMISASVLHIHTYICDSVVWLNLIFLCCHFRLMIMND